MSVVLGFVVTNLAARVLDDDPLAELPQLGVVPPIPGSLTWPTNVALVPRKTGEERIYFVGASETVAMPYEPLGHVSYANLLGAGLQRVLGRSDVHVRADGGIALDSPQLAEQARKLLQFGDPTSIVLVVGGNEFLNRLPLTEPMRPDGAFARAIDFSGSTVRIFDTVAGWLMRQSFWPGETFAHASGNVSGFDRLVREAAPERPALRGLPIGASDRELMLDRLASVVRGLAASCRERGVRFVLALAPQGYGVQPPWCSALRPSDGVRDLPFDLAKALEAGRVKGSTGMPKLEDIDRAIRAYPERADLRHLRGLSLAHAGDAEAARVAFDNALDLDKAPLHRTRAVVARLEQLARELGHELLRIDGAFDGAGVFAGEDARALFVDYAHPTIEGHRRIAHWLARSALPLLLPGLDVRDGLADGPEFAAGVSTIIASVTERSRVRARGTMFRTVGSYYMCFGNFRDALPVLEESLQVFEMWAQRDDATDEDRTDVVKARDDVAFCRRALESTK
ncbi:MAG: SGNH/GDSL hydrolase family protein [Planctomycetes bacterium]|nr:SGNH/GDSL hydrolase family protein [Planctomycetota bacterium]MCB9918726.1 SGNH/GDSL hydrolase family protein [Planctomycetota bacterium]